MSSTLFIKKIILPNPINQPNQHFLGRENHTSFHIFHFFRFSLCLREKSISRRIKLYDFLFLDFIFHSWFSQPASSGVDQSDGKTEVGLPKYGVNFSFNAGLVESSRIEDGDDGDNDEDFDDYGDAWLIVKKMAKMWCSRFWVECVDFSVFGLIVVCLGDACMMGIFCVAWFGGVCLLIGRGWMHAFESWFVRLCVHPGSVWMEFACFWWIRLPEWGVNFQSKRVESPSVQGLPRKTNSCRKMASVSLCRQPFWFSCTNSTYC